MRTREDVDREIREIFGKREGVKQQSIKNYKLSQTGSTIFLTAILLLSLAMAALPFVKTLNSKTPQATPATFYKVHADPGRIHPPGPRSFPR